MKRWSELIKRILSTPFDFIFRVEEKFNYEKYKKCKKNRDELGKKYKNLELKSKEFNEKKHKLQEEINKLNNELRNKKNENIKLHNENRRLNEEVSLLKCRIREFEQDEETNTL